MKSRIRGWMREPLLHFLIIGCALFLLYSIVAPERPEAPGSRIELTEDDLRQIELTWRAKWQRPPTPAEWRGLLDGKIREEILYREALAMGLDQDDVIVRRRLGQKLEFLLEDVSSLRDPTTAELAAWFKRNASQFALPGRVTFCHVYFSPDARGGKVATDARQALATLKGRPSCHARGTAASGDRFPDQQFYAERSPDEIASIFGTRFSETLFRMQAGNWQGPVESGFGWHLVLIEAAATDSLPAFDEVDRAQVKSAWLDSQQADSKRRAFDVMRSKYQVVLPQPSAS